MNSFTSFFRLNLRIFVALASVLLICSLSSCGSLKLKYADSDDPAYIGPINGKDHRGKKDYADHDDKKDDNKKQISASSHPLVVEARQWLGTPYLYGGETKDGADCSGFVMQVYKNALNISLPRNSAKQCEFCKKIDRSSLQPGDLLFFSSQNAGGNVAHVGMYVGEGIMIHASSSRGVIETPIDNTYFVTYFVSCGRVPGID